MKKILQVLCMLAMALAMTFGFAACGGTRSPETNDNQEQPTPTPGQPEDPKDPEEPDKLTFTDVRFESDTVVYDGKEHSLTVTGSLPQGTTVEYTNNGKTEGGEYEVTATLTNPNYPTLILKGML